MITLLLAAFPLGDTRADPGDGRLLGTNANGGSLLDIDTTDGSAVVIGFMGVGVTPSLSTDPITGTVYVATGGGNPFLYTVNPADGSTTLVGYTGLGLAAVGGMDFDAAGTLYAAVNIVDNGGTGSDHLAILDTDTGQATVIGPFGTCTFSCSIDGIEGIAFDTAGELWGVHTARGSAGPPGLYAIDPGTGAANFLAPIVDTDGIPPSGGLSSIQFACDGTLFGGTARSLGLADGGFLVTINPNTGVFSFVGVTSATGGPSLGGLGFEDVDCGLDVDIDIIPSDPGNNLNLRAGKGASISVAVLSVDGFDAPNLIDPSTLKFGPGEANISGSPHTRDVDGDGDEDLVVKFLTNETGIACGDTSARLSGFTFDLEPIIGSDATNTFNCPRTRKRW
jgi:hypothetical protein